MLKSDFFFRSQNGKNSPPKKTPPTCHSDLAVNWKFRIFTDLHSLVWLVKCILHTQ